MALRQSRSLSSLFVLALGIGMSLLGGVHSAAESLKDIGQPTNYVTDLAGVLNGSTSADLDALCRNVETQAHAQVFVVTLHKIDGDEDAQTFSTDLYHQWKIGQAKTDRGVLLLFSIDDHKRWITTGYGLEGILPDGKVGDIGREMVPDLQAGNYDGAVRTGVNDVAQVIAQDAGVTLAAGPQPRPIQHARRGGGGSNLIGILVFFFIMFMLLRGGGRGGRGGGGGFLSGLLLGGLMGGGRGGYGGGGGFEGGGGGFDGGGNSGGGFSGGGGGDSGGGGAGGGW